MLLQTCEILSRSQEFSDVVYVFFVPKNEILLGSKSQGLNWVIRKMFWGN